MSSFLSLLRVLISIFGRLFGQTIGARREVDNKRRELCLQVLVDAWRSIERAVNRTDSEERRGLELALADIQLFGTPSQADRAARVARSLNESAAQGPALGELLEVLRADLREEMRLGRVLTPLVQLRHAFATPSSVQR